VAVGGPTRRSWSTGTLAGASPGPGCFLQDHLRWSIYWDKKYGPWRVAEDDPDSDLYAESSDADTVISYIMAHT
jgi:hypothetical protein